MLAKGSSLLLPFSLAVNQRRQRWRTDKRCRPSPLLDVLALNVFIGKVCPEDQREVRMLPGCALLQAAKKGSITRQTPHVPETLATR